MRIEPATSALVVDDNRNAAAHAAGGADLTRRAMRLLGLFGFDPRKTIGSAMALPRFWRDYAQFKRDPCGSARAFPVTRFHPCLADRRDGSGIASGHYFHQDLLVAARIHEARPRRHIDVGSRVDGFVAHVAVFREIEVADIRTLDTTAGNIRFRQCDLMNPASVGVLGTADSVSCLHALEHFGLGRYGEAVSADGHLRGLANLCALVERGGTLHLSVPIGPQRTEFNSQRVFAATTLPALVPPGFRLERFSFVDDSGDLYENVEFSQPAARHSFGCRYGCGIYEFRNDA